MSTITFHLFTFTLANAMTSIMVYGPVWYTGSTPSTKTSVTGACSSMYCACLTH